MFFMLLLVVLAGAAVQVARGPDRSTRRSGEIVLVWVLVGYCGLPMVAVSVAALAWPEAAAAHLGLPSGGPMQAFMGVAYLALAVIATLSLWHRGSYLLAPGLAWTIFFAGATAIHLGHEASRGGLTHGGMLAIFATHGLVSVILLVGLVASGRLRGR